ncbi:MAG TPA: type II toxin-antitoxin system mRNA interferase toxin, RelE/StbE family [Candidatus Paceibacterota bacterium]
MASSQIREIVFDRGFEKKFEKYKGRLSEKERQKLKSRLLIFQKNPFDARLETHKLGGKLQDYWAFSITYSDRIAFRFLSEYKVFFIDIGDHRIYR